MNSTLKISCQATKFVEIALVVPNIVATSSDTSRSAALGLPCKIGLGLSISNLISTICTRAEWEFENKPLYGAHMISHNELYYNIILLEVVSSICTCLKDRSHSKNWRHPSAPRLGGLCDKHSCTTHIYLRYPSFLDIYTVSLRIIKAVA